MARLARTAHSTRPLVVVFALACVTALAFVIGPRARSAESVETRRLGGTDRYDTAREIAVSTFGSSDFVILARGDDYPDALAGTYIAGASPGAPILLTPKNSLSPAAVSGIETLDAEGVILLGGTEAISQAVENDLKSRGLATRRLFGTDRYSTAAAIAKSVSPPGSLDSKPTALIASGEVFADALTGGPMAFRSRFPLLLTEATRLPPATDSTLTELGIQHAIILGGNDRITPAIEARLTAKGISSQRLAGATRRSTATAIASFERSRLGFVASHVNLARGDAFPDALAGGPHAGIEQSPILLTENPDALGSETADYLRANAGDIRSIDAFGGRAAISDATLAAAKSAATCTPTTTTTSGGLPGGTTTTTSSTTTTTSSSTSSTSATSSTAPTSTTSTTSPPCPASSTTTTSGGSTTTTSSPPGGGLCAVLPIPGCPGATTTTSTSTTTSSTSTSTTTTTAP